ncbi:MAG: DNA-binding NarL/FixJ family response regulator [Halioglobus sp.]|jgi:DNA-binding NarL/FixJ family response regulator
MPVRALIIDDHPIIQEALTSSLLTLGVFEEIETACSFRELLEKLEREASYQLLILDLSLTDISGSDGMVYVRENYPDIPIIIFSGNDSAEIISQCFEYGVHGFVSKNSSMQVMVNAIQIVLAGSVYIPPSAANLMGFAPSPPRPSSLESREEKIHFTPKQQEVFEQLMQGVPNKVISKRLNVAEGTVKAHLHSIYQSLGVSSRAQAILKAQQLQII